MIRRHLLLAATCLLAAGCAPGPKDYVLFPYMRTEPLYQGQPPGATFDREYETPFGPAGSAPRCILDRYWKTDPDTDREALRHMCRTTALSLGWAVYEPSPTQLVKYAPYSDGYLAEFLVSHFLLNDGSLVQKWYGAFEVIPTATPS